jgi:hypothetical protein
MKFSNTYIVQLGGDFLTNSMTITSGDNAYTYEFLRQAFLLGPSTNALKFYITEGYTETLAFLRGKGYDFSGGAADITGITKIYAEKYRLNLDYGTQALYFRAHKLIDPSDSANFKEIPLERLTELMAVARTHYYVPGGGYLLYIERPGAEGSVERVTLFIPEADAPGDLNEMF